MNIFTNKLIHTHIYWQTLDSNFKGSLSLCVFINSSNGPTVRRKTYIYSYSCKQTNVFITLRQLYIETGDIFICLLCVRLMAALVRLGAEKQEKMLCYFLSFSFRLHLFSSPSSGRFTLLEHHRLRILELNVNSCLCAKIWTCQTEVRSRVAGSLVNPTPFLRITVHA